MSETDSDFTTTMRRIINSWVTVKFLCMLAFVCILRMSIDGLTVSNVAWLITAVVLLLVVWVARRVLKAKTKGIEIETEHTT